MSLRAPLMCVLALTIAVGSSGGAKASGDGDVPPHLVEVVQTALHDWSRFANTPALEVVDASFVPGGPQWRQFESEAGEATAAGRPALLTARQLRIRTLEESRATVWAEVEASRSGFRSEVYGWDFDLVYMDSEWRVWTVVAADEPTALVEAASDPVQSSTSTTLRALRPTVVAPSDFDSEMVAAEPSTAQGTRIPALSAWIVVVTLAGVAAAGYMAPRIDRKGER